MNKGNKRQLNEEGNLQEEVLFLLLKIFIASLSSHEIFFA